MNPNRAITFLPVEAFATQDHAGKYRPKADAYQQLKDYAVFWASQLLRYHNRECWDNLRRQGSIMLAYISGCTTMPNSKSYLPYEQFQGWLLRDADGNPVRWSNDPKSIYHDRYYLDVREIRMQARAAEFFADFARAFDGLGLDNTIIGWDALDRFGFDEQAKDQWEAAYIDYLGRIKRALGDKLLITNHTAMYRSDDFSRWSDLIAAVDGLMSECPIQTKDSDPPAIYDGDLLADGLKIHQVITHAGRYDWWVWYHRQTAPEAYRIWQQVRTDKSLFTGVDIKTRSDYAWLWQQGRKYLQDYEDEIRTAEAGVKSLIKARDEYIARVRQADRPLGEVMDKTDATFEQCERLLEG